MAAVTAIIEALGVAAVLEEINIVLPITIYTDSTVCLSVLNRLGAGSRLKHVQTKFFFVQELVRSGRIKTCKVDTKENPADIGTKSLGASVLQPLLPRAGMKMSLERQSVSTISSLVSNPSGPLGAFLAALVTMMQQGQVRADPGQCVTAAWEEDKKDRSVFYLMTIVLVILVVGAAMGYAMATVKLMKMIFPNKEKKEATMQTDIKEQNEGELFVTQYGQRYHRRRDCGGLASARSPNSVTACRVCMR